MRWDIFKHEFVANLPVSLSTKKRLKNWLTFGEVMGKILVFSCFLTHGVGSKDSARLVGLLNKLFYLFICQNITCNIHSKFTMQQAGHVPHLCLSLI